MTMARGREVAGVDFSAAQDAGRRLWWAEGTWQDGVLTIADCRPAMELPGGGRDREGAFAALRGQLRGARGRLVGLDLNFSLPAALIPEGDWRSFALGFAGRHADPEAFRAHCRELSGGREWLRETERAARVPFSAYNLRMYRQTWHGLAAVLAPLLATDAVVCLPFATRDPERATLLEACPASFLKLRGLYRSYKGSGEEARRERGAILDALVPELRFAEPSLRARVLGNVGGDALDSVLATRIAADVCTAPGPLSAMGPSMEGRVFTGGAWDIFVGHADS